jgi:hypothetical protein
VQGADYGRRTWSRGITRLALLWSWSVPAPRGCGHGYLPLPTATMTGWPSLIRQALSCGSYRIVGHQRLDGVDTIKIESVFRQPPPCLALRNHQTLWVNPSSYLPVRIARNWWPRHRPLSSLVGDFRWLEPNAANLANLRAPVPGGFRRIRIEGIPSPGFVLIAAPLHKVR